MVVKKSDQEKMVTTEMLVVVVRSRERKQRQSCDAKSSELE